MCKTSPEMRNSSANIKKEYWKYWLGSFGPAIANRLQQGIRGHCDHIAKRVFYSRFFGSERASNPLRPHNRPPCGCWYFHLSKEFFWFEHGSDANCALAHNSRGRERTGAHAPGTSSATRRARIFTSKSSLLRLSAELGFAALFSPAVAGIPQRVSDVSVDMPGFAFRVTMSAGPISCAQSADVT